MLPVLPMPGGWWWPWWPLRSEWFVGELRHPLNWHAPPMYGQLVWVLKLCERPWLLLVAMVSFGRGGILRTHVSWRRGAPALWRFGRMRGFLAQTASWSGIRFPATPVRLTDVSRRASLE